MTTADAEQHRASFKLRPAATSHPQALNALFLLCLMCLCKINMLHIYHDTAQPSDNFIMITPSDSFTLPSSGHDGIVSASAFAASVCSSLGSTNL
jgi:hypothetical protein